MSDFFTGILSEIYLFSYTYRLRSYFFNIFFLQYSLPDLPEGIDKAAHPAQVGVLHGGRKIFFVGHLPGSAFAFDDPGEGVVFGGTGTPACVRSPGRGGLVHLPAHSCLPVFWSRDMTNPFLGQPARGRSDPPICLHHEASKSPAMLSSKFWRNLLPAGKDFTNPAPNFLPAGISVFGMAEAGTRRPRLRRFHRPNPRSSPAPDVWV